MTKQETKLYKTKIIQNYKKDFRSYILIGLTSENEDLPNIVYYNIRTNTRKY